MSTQSEASPATDTSLLVLSGHDLDKALPYDRLIEAVAEAMRALSMGEMALPLRQLADVMPLGRFGIMPGARPNAELAAVKVLAFPAVPGLLSHDGAVLVFEGPHMAPRAIMQADRLTARRTAAASAVATHALARHEARSLAILGAGTQAMAHIEALRMVRPITDLRLWSRNPERTACLAAETGARACASAAEAVHGADIVCTLTASPAPILAGGDLAPGAHVNLVGASLRERREADDDVIDRGRLFVDSRASALAQAGELTGRFGPERIVAEIGEVLRGAPGRGGDGEITVYKSLGVGAQDLAAARLAMDLAAVYGLGTRAAWG